MTTRAPTTAATQALDRLGIVYTTHPYEHVAGTTGYGLEAAAAPGVDAARVFTTLLVQVPGGFAVAVVPVSATLELRALGIALGVKHVAMAEPKAAERRTGFVVGGISPIGQRTPSPLVLDAGAEHLDTVSISGGRCGFDLGLAPADLLRATGGRTAAIAR